VQALETRRLKLLPKFSIDVEAGDRLGGRKGAEILLEQITRKNFPTACVCGNASTARGVINYLMQKGWRVPEDISVVAIDATRICVEENPQITAAHADPEKTGTTAAELLLRSADVKDGMLSDVILPSQLTIRETSTIPPA
jgi:LacI family transcriptional regulator